MRAVSFDSRVDEGEHGFVEEETGLEKERRRVDERGGNIGLMGVENGTDSCT